MQPAHLGNEWLQSHHEQLVGQPEAEAARLVLAAGLEPSSIPANRTAITADLRPRRITLWVDANGIVTSAGAG